MSRFNIHIEKTLPGFRLDARLHTDAARVVIIGSSGSGKTLFYAGRRRTVPAGRRPHPHWRSRGATLRRAARRVGLAPPLNPNVPAR